ncbi:MAG: hypothetical protein WAN89_05775 [Lawsonella sp.]|nr:hypothetical protein [Mycobacteriales bacterium]
MDTAPTASTGSTETWSCLQQWWTAVDTAGFGFYGNATGMLATVMDTAQNLPAPDRYLVTALCSATQASWERQAGRHQDAAALDDQARELMRQELPREDTGLAPDTAEYLQLLALADATTGRTADTLGENVSGSAQELLYQGDDVLAALHEYPFPMELQRMVGTEADNSLWVYCGLHTVRATIRHSWVSAEVAMAEGNWNEAQTFGKQAVELSSHWFSPRHQVKSLLVEAAATSGLAPEEGRDKAKIAFSAARNNKFLPLEWAAAMLLRNLPGEDAAYWDEHIGQLREQLNERGAYYPE